jgi:hypothetical protein
MTIFKRDCSLLLLDFSDKREDFLALNYYITLGLENYLFQSSLLFHLLEINITVQSYSESKLLSRLLNEHFASSAEIVKYVFCDVEFSLLLKTFTAMLTYILIDFTSQFYHLFEIIS